MWRICVLFFFFANAGYGEKIIYPSGHSEFAACARQGKIEVCKQWLEKDKKNNPFNGQEEGTLQSPLMAACLAGQDKAVDFMLENGADPSIPEKDGYWPHDGAAFQGRPEVTKVLLKHKISPAYFHNDGQPPIFRACWGNREGHSEVVRILIEEGGEDVNQKNKNGQTLVQASRSKSTTNILKKLIKKKSKSEL